MCRGQKLSQDGPVALQNEGVGVFCGGELFVCLFCEQESDVQCCPLCVAW